MIGEAAYNNYAFSLCTSYSDNGMMRDMDVRPFGLGIATGHGGGASRPTRFWIGDWRRQGAAAWGDRDRISLLRGVSSAKHVFLRNEPTVFGEGKWGY